MLYYNDAGNIFRTLVQACLGSSDICELYGIDVVEFADTVWKVLTPEAASGMTVMLAQIVVMPRTLSSKLFGGNLKDDGRRNVAYTRARYFLSTHILEECVECKGAPEHWQKHLKMIQGDDLDVVHINCNNEATDCYARAHAWLSSAETSEKQETSQLQALRQQTESLPAIIAQCVATEIGAELPKTKTIGIPFVASLYAEAFADNREHACPKEEQTFHMSPTLHNHEIKISFLNQFQAKRVACLFCFSLGVFADGVCIIILMEGKPTRYT